MSPIPLRVILKSVLITGVSSLIFFKSSPHETSCTPLSHELYDLVKSEVNLKTHHGYHRFLLCGQLFYQDIQPTRQGFASDRTEEYARLIKLNRGTGVGIAKHGEGGIWERFQIVG